MTVLASELSKLKLLINIIFHTEIRRINNVTGELSNVYSQIHEFYHFWVFLQQNQIQNLQPQYYFQTKNYFSCPLLEKKRYNVDLFMKLKVSVKKNDISKNILVSKLFELTHLHLIMSTVSIMKSSLCVTYSIKFYILSPILSTHFRT